MEKTLEENRDLCELLKVREHIGVEFLTNYGFRHSFTKFKFLDTK